MQMVMKMMNIFNVSDMIVVKDTSQINKLDLNAKQACKILASRKKYLVMVENELASQGAAMSLFSSAIRGDFPGYEYVATQDLDKKTTKPGWLVPIPKAQTEVAWNRNQLHQYKEPRHHVDLDCYGVDIRTGVRDWNEEIQLAREMPTDTIFDRMDRA